MTGGIHRGDGAEAGAIMHISPLKNKAAINRNRGSQHLPLHRNGQCCCLPVKVVYSRKINCCKVFLCVAEMVGEQVPVRVSANSHREYLLTEIDLEGFFRSQLRCHFFAKNVSSKSHGF